MKFNVSRVWRGGYDEVVDEYPIIRGFVDNEDGSCILEVDKVEDLVKFQKELDIPIILDGNSIEIYDDYRE